LRIEAYCASFIDVTDCNINGIYRAVSCPGH
jgi:hypothetical protein